MTCHIGIGSLKHSKVTVHNFCCEPGRNYPHDIFDGRVERYPFRDHAVPALAMTRDFCSSAKARACARAHAKRRVAVGVRLVAGG